MRLPSPKTKLSRIDRTCAPQEGNFMWSCCGGSIPPGQQDRLRVEFSYIALAAIRHASVRFDRLWAGRQMGFEVAQDISIHVHIGAFAFGDAMRAAGIDALLELFAERDEFIDEQLEALEVHVVIARAVHHHQVAAQSRSKIDGRALC